jgi:nicotinamide-nucleotide amidase
MDYNFVVSKVAIIVIGDELMSGFTVNMNSSWIAKKISSYKDLEIIYNVIVSDDSVKIKVELDYLLERDFKYIFITGGLGPTHDDITKKSLSEYFSSKLIVNKQHLKKLQKKFSDKNISNNPHIINQSEILELSKPLINNNGTALGMSINIHETTLFIMPGVPKEMHDMMRNYILPNFIESAYSKNKACITILTSGIYETSLFNKLREIIEENKETFKVAFLPSFKGVKIRISSIDTNINVNIFYDFQKKIEDQISDYIFGYNEDKIEDVVAKILLDKNLTLSVAESCTGGGVSKILTSISGSSRFYKGGIVAYSNEIKINVLDIKKTLIDDNGPVSKEVADAMSMAIRNKFKTDIGISITGISGPSGGSKEKPTGLVYISICVRKKKICKKFIFKTERNIHRELTISSSLNLLRRLLIEIN